MILKFIDSPLLSSNDEAEAIGKLNEFLAELGKKASQENKVELEEEIKVWSWLCYCFSYYRESPRNVSVLLVHFLAHKHIDCRIIVIMRAYDRARNFLQHFTRGKL